MGDMKLGLRNQEQEGEPHTPWEAFHTQCMGIDQGEGASPLEAAREHSE